MLENALKYSLCRKLVEGATSEVWEASYKEHKYALKLLKPSTIPEIDFKHLRLFKNEVKILSKLKHPNITTLYEVSDNDLLYQEDQNFIAYITFELAEKGDMFDYVSRTGSFSEPLARHYFKILLDALEYIHNQGYAHRNLKLENLLLTSDYQLKVADFGHSSLDNVLEDSMTSNYSAPEIYAKIPHSGIKADLFSLGVLLFIIVAGHPPFNKAGMQDKWFKIFCSSNTKFWMNMELRRKFSQEFKDLVNRLLSIKAEERLSINHIRAHEWFNGSEMSYEEVKEEMDKRCSKFKQ